MASESPGGSGAGRGAGRAARHIMRAKEPVGAFDPASLARDAPRRPTWYECD